MSVVFLKKYDIIINGGVRMGTLKSILEAALKMTPADRYIIIDGLLNSLDTPDKTIDEIWAEEAENRLQAYKRGTAKTVAFEDLFGREAVG